ncbi:hypothetical protein B566_EDAN018291, partial [Ephemera danica]
MSKQTFRNYYLTQAGSGVSNVYSGREGQRGHGIGSFLGGLFRRALPFLKNGLKAVGKEAAKAGLGMLHDVSNDVTLKDSFRERFDQAKGNLKRKAEEKLENIMKGSGYKIKKKRRSRQSRTVRRRVKTKRRNKGGRRKTGIRKNKSLLRKKRVSFIHSKSNICTKSELDLFSVPPTQTSIERGHYDIIKPLNAVSDESPIIEFVIPASGSEYIDLSHTEIHAKLKVTKGNGTDLAATDIYAPINYILATMFSNIEIYLNNKLITPVTNAASYRAMIELMLNYGKMTKESQLTAKGVYMDTAKSFDLCTDANAGFTKRKNIFAKSKVVDLVGYMHSDIFNQDRYMLNGVEIRLRLIRSRDAFCLMSDTVTGMKLKIVDIFLNIRRVEVNPSIALAHEEALKLTSAKFPINRVDIKVMTIPAGLLSKSLDNVFVGQIPKRVVVGMVENKAYNGELKRNPFSFQHFSLSSFSLVKDGRQIPSRPIECDFDENKHYTQAFQTLLSGTGLNFMNEDVGLNVSDFPHGNMLLVFDLTPDLSASCMSHWQIRENGSLGIELRFAKELESTINLVVYGEFDNLIEIKHWIALYVTKQGECQYFDSFGLPPRNVDMKKFLIKKKWSFSRMKLQGLTSD